MPYSNRWINNPKFTTHKGITIYRIYKNDEVDCGMRDYWFGLAPDSSDEGMDSFDIRELPTWDPAADEVEDTRKGFRKIIKAAIDQGIIYRDGDVTKVKG